MNEAAASFEFSTAEPVIDVENAEALEAETLSDDELLMRALAEEGFINHEQQESLEISRQATMDEVRAHFGGQVFQYKQYSGDIDTIFALCPEMRRIIDQGAPVVIATFEGHKISNTDDQMENGEQVEEASEETRNELETTHDAQTKEAKPKTTPGDTKQDHLTTPLLKKDKPVQAAQAKKPFIKEDKAAKEIKSRPKQVTPPELPSIRRQKVEKKEVEKQEVAPTYLPFVAHMMDEGEPLVITDTYEIRPADKETVIEHALREEMPDERIETPELYIVTEPIERVEADEVNESDEIVERDVTIEISQNITELVQVEASLDTLFVAIIEVIEHDEMPESDESLYALLSAVALTKESVEQLYAAATKQECAEALEQIVMRLTLILHDLGYENPEAIIQAYMNTHSIDSLKYLIERLERLLIVQLERNGRAVSKSTDVHPRHTRLGKIASYIMKLLLPQEQLA